MKFAQYLASSQTPEWRKAYIDYKGLKKLIKAVRQSYSPKGLKPHGQLSSVSGAGRPSIVASSRAKGIGPNETSSASQPHQSDGSIFDQTTCDRNNNISQNTHYGSMEHTPPMGGHENVSVPSILSLPPPMQAVSERQSLDEMSDSTHPDSLHQRMSPIRSLSDDIIIRPRTSVGDLGVISEEVESGAVNSRNSITNSPRLRRSIESSGNRRLNFRRAFSLKKNSRGKNSSFFTSLHALYAALTPEEKSFFEKLDEELEKVNHFYQEREEDVEIRFATLKDQLRQLQDHEQEAHPTENNWTLSRAMDATGLNFSINPKALKPGHKNSQEVGNPGPSHDPEEYQTAKKRLKKALLEFYRLLELLKNYRLLNTTGFRKALKKFDKTAGSNSLELYTREKIDPRSISSGDDLDAKIKKVEELYAECFYSNRDVKAAQARLRATYTTHSHHMSTFRSGLMIGLGIPPLAAGLYESFQPHLRASIPQFSALLQNYATLFIPVVFALLIGLNMQAWRISRINWVFIFELDVRSAIDTREAFELPAFLFFTLCISFWLSFSLLTVPHLDPTLLPVIWLGVLAITLFNPMQVFFKDTRWWFLKKAGKLFVSGKSRVEFTDFWMGDQFCSLIYTTTKLYFFSCSYITGFHDPWKQCVPRPNNWVYYWLLAALPNLIRLVQSVKRYFDSKLYTHLINGGKYTSSVVSYMVYYSWRGRGSPYDWHLAIWIIFSVIMSTYTSAWDLLMDWSVLKRDQKRPLLRPSLLYDNWIPMYYFAIISDVIIRFLWFIYIPKTNFLLLSSPIRSFVVAVLEMLRRWQWNFFRLENEHIGNTDQYRVTREIPLPYSHENDGEGVWEEGAESLKGMKLPTTDANDRVPIDENEAVV